jgi:preprotein translocase subunit SecD
MKRSLGWLAGIYLVCCSRAVAQTPPRARSLIELRAVRDRPAAGYSVRQSIGDTTFYLAERPLVSDNDIVEASTDTTGGNSVVLRIELKPGAASRLKEFTQQHIGEQLAVLLNGQLSGSPAVIRDPVSSPLEMDLRLCPAPAHRFTAAVRARWHSGH